MRPFYSEPAPGVKIFSRAQCYIFVAGLSHQCAIRKMADLFSLEHLLFWEFGFIGAELQRNACCL